MPDISALRSAIDVAYRARERAELEVYDRLEAMIESRDRLAASFGESLLPDAGSALGPLADKIADAHAKLGALTGEWLHARGRYERANHDCRAARSAFQNAGGN